jgi:hypothetical protein
MHNCANLNGTNFWKTIYKFILGYFLVLVYICNMFKLEFTSFIFYCNGQWIIFEQMFELFVFFWNALKKH